MKYPKAILSLLLLSSVAFAEPKGTLIFEDRFDRNESQETKEDIGKGWGSNSDKRAHGNKQVDLRDGAMYITFHASADHAVSVTHPAEFQDGVIELRFMLEDAKDSLGLNFADLKFKEVHAGHLCMAKINTRSVQLADLKTGNMAMSIYDLKKAKKLTAEHKAMLKTKAENVPNTLKAGTWYDLKTSIVGDTLSVTIDGKEVGSFSSEGIAHPTKRLLRLSVPRNAVIDDIKIYALK